MAVGTQQDASAVNGWAGSIALDLERIMTEIQHFKAFLDATPDATLLAAPYSFAQADINTLRSAFGDLNTLASIYYGTAAQGTQAYDFRTFSKLLRGVSCW